MAEGRVPATDFEYVFAMHETQLAIACLVAKRGRPITITKADAQRIGARSLRVDCTPDSYRFSLEAIDPAMRPGVLYLDVPALTDAEADSIAAAR